HEGAPIAIALVNGTPNGSGDVSGRRGNGRLTHGLARLVGCRVTAATDLLDLVRYGPLDDRRQVAVRDFGSHQGSKSFELVAQPRAGRELDLVACVAKRLDHVGLGRRLSNSVRT